MSRRLPPIAVALCAILAWPTAAGAEQTSSQRLFRSKLLRDPGVTGYVKSRLRRSGFVDRRVLFSDLTGEGKSDAVVLVHSGGSAGRIAVYVFSSLSGRDLRIVWSKQTLFRGSARLLGTTRSRPLGAVEVREPIYDPGDDVCCPGAHRESEMRWNRNSRRFRLAASRTVDHVNGEQCRSSPRFCATAKRLRAGIFMTLRAHGFRGRYFLCVIDPGGREECHRFTLQESSGSSYFSRVRWQDHFRDGGRGRYRVYWVHDGRRLGGVLTFRRR